MGEGWDLFLQYMNRGGYVMWPLLGLSIIGLALIFERGLFFLRTNHPGQLQRLSRLASLLRAGEHERAKQLADRDGSVYGALVRRLEPQRATEALGHEAVEALRPRLERFMPLLSTIITAAPMLGILGTVIGIISSFSLLSDLTGSMAGDPRAVSEGIAKALLTTACGLGISVAALFPYNLFRAQVERTLSRLESLAAAAVHGTAQSGSEDAADRSDA
jgi:biopolymer transport protein ExbB